MKNIARLVVLIFLVLSLAACRARATETPEPTLLPPTPEPTLVQPTPEPTATRPPVPTRAPTPIPSPTVRPAPYIGTSVMGIEISGGEFGSLAANAADAGAFWIRWNAVRWSDVEPVQGDRRWEALADFEEQLAQINAQGLKLVLIVRSTPPWAQRIPGSFCGPVSEEALDDFGEFMFDLVSRYSQEPYGIKYWEIGNEPDIDPRFVESDYHFGCWAQAGDPYYGGRYYAEALKAVYPQVKAADPDSQVLVGGLLLDCDPTNPPETSPGSGVKKDCTPAKYLEGILENGGGDYFDGVSFHAYDFFDPTSGLFGNPNWHNGYRLSGLVPVVVPKTRFIKTTLASYGYNDKLLFNTETSILCGRELFNEPGCVDGAFDQMKARYIPMSYAAALSEGLQGNIWYSLNNAWRRNLLITPAGGLTDAFRAYQVASEQLTGVSYWGPINEYEGVTGYKFRRAGQEIWVIWSLDGGAHAVALPDGLTATVGVLGEALEPSGNQEIGVAPRYLIWGP